MGTMKAQQSWSTVVVTEENKFLAEYPHLFRSRAVGQVFSKGDWLPVAPQQLSARSPSTGLGQQIILFLRDHVYSTSAIVMTVAQPSPTEYAAIRIISRKAV
jgi:hypothetical protein